MFPDNKDLAVLILSIRTTSTVIRQKILLIRLIESTLVNSVRVNHKISPYQPSDPRLPVETIEGSHTLCYGEWIASTFSSYEDEEKSLEMLAMPEKSCGCMHINIHT